jgi:regulatory protein
LSTRASPKQPSETSLREAALRHLARYAATEARLLRVLERRIERWRRAAQATDPEDETIAASVTAARQAARRVVASLAASRVVDDAAYAETRARALLRAGRSRAVVGRRLAQSGIGAEILRTALDVDPAHDLAAALLLARRRRLGGFADHPPDPAIRQRELGILARAGFSHDVAQAALTTTEADGERQIAEWRRK